MPCLHYLLPKICVEQTPWELGGLHLCGHTSIRHFFLFLRRSLCFGLAFEDFLASRCVVDALHSSLCKSVPSSLLALC